MRRAGCAAFALLLLLGPQAGAEPHDVAVVDVGRPAARPLNDELLGLDHPAHSQAVENLLRTRVPSLAWMRVDTFFEDGSVTVAPDGSPSLDPSAIDARLESVAASGADPLLILDYLPPAMAEPTCAARSGFFPGASRCPPADLAKWKDLVRQAVRHACCETNTRTGLPNAVRWFEVWNEPDFPPFYAGTLADYLMLYKATDDAMRDVEAESGVELHIGGPALLFPDPPWIVGLLALAAATGAGLDFLSWHHYANSPFFGPLPGVPVTPDAEHPLFDAGVYADHTNFVRRLAEPFRALGVDPLLWLDEWNVNAGADPRHGTAFAAAFTAAAFHAMEDTGLDRAARFNTQDDSPSPLATWGMFTHDGRPKPVFHAYQAWARLEPRRVEVLPSPDAGPADERYRHGVLAGARADASRITVLAYAFAPRGEPDSRTFAPTITGTRGDYVETVYIVDDARVVTGAEDLVVLRGPRPVHLPGPLDPVELAPNAIALVVLERA